MWQKSKEGVASLMAWATAGERSQMLMSPTSSFTATLSLLAQFGFVPDHA